MVVKKKITLPEISESDEMEILRLEKKSAHNYKDRRVIDWNDNYQLYRDKILTNRLTQRQTINIPLMKYGIATNLKDIDDAPIFTFRNLNNNDQAAIYYNELWKETARVNKLVVKDIVDKKQMLLFGRSFKKLNIVDGKVTFEIIAPEDMLVQRYTDPASLESSRCLIQIGIFKTLTSILNNEDYLESGKSQLRTYISTVDPQVVQDESQQSILNKNQRAQDMGIPDAVTPVVGETYIELNEVYRVEQNPKNKGEEEIFIETVADVEGTLIKLQKQPFDEVFGKTTDDFWKHHYPYSTVASDPERTDFWSDGAGDVLRQPNKVLNSWASQLVENRTLRNFNMNYYDSSNPSFVPQTYTPEPWGWYPLPGKPSDVLQSVQVADLSESLDEMQFLIGIAEKAIAATATQTGETQSNVTLGDIQLSLANAQDRVKSVEPMLTDSWDDFAHKYIKLLEGRSDILDDVTINRRGRLGKKMYTKTIKMSDLDLTSGYAVEVKVKGTKGSQDTDSLQKLNFAKSLMPNNVPLKEVVNKKALEFADLPPDDLARVLEFEKEQEAQMATAAMLNGGMGANGMQMNGPVGPNGQPVQGQIAAPAPQMALAPAKTQ